MNRWISRTVVMTTLVGIAGVAMAQGGAGMAQGGGRGGPGGVMMGRGGGLLSLPEVKKELKITAAQSKKLDTALQPQAAAGGRRPQGGPGGPGGNDQAARAKRNAERDAKIKGILNATQFKRYHELRLQQQQAGALGDSATGAKIGLSKAQQDKIRAIQTKATESLRAKFQGGAQRPDMDKMRAAFAKMRQDTNAKILATLSAPQKAKWTALLGKPFKFAAR